VLHQNSVFHAVLQGVPWDVFDRLVAAHGSDRGVRTLTTKSQFAALLYGQLSGSSSLREIAAGLESHKNRLYHLGVRAARRSTVCGGRCAGFSRHRSQWAGGTMDETRRLGSSSPK